MKKIIILCFLSLLLIKPARPAGDAAAIVAFLAPYMGALQSISETTGMDIEDLRNGAQKALEISSRIVETFSNSTELVEMGNNVKKIYVTYLETTKYVYENSIYLSNAQIKEIMNMLDYAAYGYKVEDINRPKGIATIAGGALEQLPKLMNVVKEGGNASLKDINDMMKESRSDIIKSLRDTKSVRSYARCLVAKKQKELGMRDINKHKRKIITKFGL